MKLYSPRTSKAHFTNHVNSRFTWVRIQRANLSPIIIRSIIQANMFREALSEVCWYVPKPILGEPLWQPVRETHDALPIPDLTKFACHVSISTFQKNFPATPLSVCFISAASKPISPELISFSTKRWLQLSDLCWRASLRARVTEHLTHRSDRLGYQLQRWRKKNKKTA